MNTGATGLFQTLQLWLRAGMIEDVDYIELDGVVLMEHREDCGGVSLVRLGTGFHDSFLITRLGNQCGDNINLQYYGHQSTERLRGDNPR